MGFGSAILGGLGYGLGSLFGIQDSAGKVGEKIGSFLPFREGHLTNYNDTILKTRLNGKNPAIPSMEELDIPIVINRGGKTPSYFMGGGVNHKNWYTNDKKYKLQPRMEVQGEVENVVQK